MISNIHKSKRRHLSDYTIMRKILKSKMNGGNIIKAINSWALPAVRYAAGIKNWKQAVLEDLDRKTRKLMSAHHALHPQSDEDRLYLPRQIDGRELFQIRQTVREDKRALSDYTLKTAQNILCKQSLMMSCSKWMNRKANTTRRS